MGPRIVLREGDGHTRKTRHMIKRLHSASPPDHRRGKEFNHL